MPSRQRDMFPCQRPVVLLCLAFEQIYSAFDSANPASTKLPKGDVVVRVRTQCFGAIRPVPARLCLLTRRWTMPSQPRAMALAATTPDHAADIGWPCGRSPSRRQEDRRASNHPPSSAPNNLLTAFARLALGPFCSLFSLPAHHPSSLLGWQTPEAKACLWSYAL
jgi:hypothetical protein